MKKDKEIIWSRVDTHNSKENHEAAIRAAKKYHKKHDGLKEVRVPHPTIPNTFIIKYVKE